MNVKELLIKFQEYQLEYEVLNANCAHNAAANLFMERYGIKNCFIPDVVGQSEQLVCDSHSPDLEHFMKYSESICKKCKQKV